jgi:hypothetical protein
MTEPEAITRAPRHDWKNASQREIPACESPDGCDRIDRICPTCKIMRITVMPPRGCGYHLWRHENGKQIPLSRVPPCVQRVRE